MRWIEPYPLDAHQAERAVRGAKSLAGYGDPPRFQTGGLSSGDHYDGIFIDGCAGRRREIVSCQLDALHSSDALFPAGI